MFARIARRYDLANRLLSFGADVGWRRQLVNSVRVASPRDILDLATGSGDVAFALAHALPEAQITGMDFCLPMLEEAEKKRSAAPASARTIRFRQGDGLAIPLPDGSCDAATISFGLRNMADRHRCLTELCRVLRPGGRLFVLEFSQPQRWFRPFYLFYLRHILPRLAGWVTGDRAAYAYLNDTIEQFPGKEALAEEIRAAGFQQVSARRMTFGIVALHEAQR
jgi:demethylmenaquinone methyltransferase/2-methoxy-6-polyprenyl-1,4-benzoquinol methylase